MKVKKILSLLLCMLMLATAIPFSASALTVIYDINAMIPIPTVGETPTDKGGFVNGKARREEFSYHRTLGRVPKKALPDTKSDSTKVRENYFLASSASSFD